ncbi:hypothetical protein PtA15_2A127 [Puccinia triticina]|uniref:N-alpha-acetyltransferase 40 n=1 Tax=Puccinia triticina TaxID=208348 RepID=A0ABY7CD83_9BASI|nr:uncharacterized protein PtA15_2A127 [Puccinia triticina]WAQ81815.1 hypothetical protein PtA15_2A127 [Puccinia triticina]WAR52704.1 hypothetical protein PtB15_2B129 [Puccinia triticina]
MGEMSEWTAQTCQDGHEPRASAKSSSRSPTTQVINLTQNKLSGDIIELDIMLDPVALAIRASAELIAQGIDESHPDFLVSVGDTRWRIQIRRSADLTPELKKECFEIFESNMKQIYLKSSHGYKPKAKKRELFHPDSRFLLASTPDEGKSLLPVHGFLMWRFDFEECFSPEEGMVEVAYCYEIQLKPETRGKGLGKLLMEILERIGSSWAMKKLMLTVQTENENAVQFYRSLNFLPDEISPSQVEQPEGEPKADYEILSKTL